MKIKRISVLTIILIISFSNCIYATNTITEIANGFLNAAAGASGGFNVQPATEGFQDIAGLLVGIGIFIAVGVGIILGIKFMFSSADGKAEILKLLTPYVIGVVIIVGALTIWKIAIEILDVY